MCFATETQNVFLLPGIWSHHFMANRWGNSGDTERLFFGGEGRGATKSLQMVTAAIKLKDTCSLEEKL